MKYSMPALILCLIGVLNLPWAEAEPSFSEKFRYSAAGNERITVDIRHGKFLAVKGLNDCTKLTKIKVVTEFETRESFETSCGQVITGAFSAKNEKLVVIEKFKRDGKPKTLQLLDLNNGNVLQNIISPTEDHFIPALLPYLDREGAPQVQLILAKDESIQIFRFSDSNLSFEKVIRLPIGGRGFNLSGISAFGGQHLVINRAEDLDRDGYISDNENLSTLVDVLNGEQVEMNKSQIVTVSPSGIYAFNSYPRADLTKRHIINTKSGSSVALSDPFNLTPQALKNPSSIFPRDALTAGVGSVMSSIHAFTDDEKYLLTSNYHSGPSIIACNGVLLNAYDSQVFDSASGFLKYQLSYERLHTSLKSKGFVTDRYIFSANGTCVEKVELVFRSFDFKEIKVLSSIDAGSAAYVGATALGSKGFVTIKGNGAANDYVYYQTP